MGKKGQKYQILSYDEKQFALKSYFERGLNTKEVAANLGIGESTIREWLKRINYDFANIEVLKPKEKRIYKNKIITELPEWVKNEILSLIKKQPGIGPLKLKQYFFRHHQSVLSEKRIYWFLKEKGIIAKRNANKEKINHDDSRRFEYPMPMAAVQLDLLTIILSGGTKIYLVTFLDDYSRFILLSRLIPVKTMKEVIVLLIKVVGLYGIMERLITDKGSEFVSWQSFTDFEETLCNLDIELIASGPEKPQNQGKIERWHQSFRKECEEVAGCFDSRAQAQYEIDKYVGYYNYERPHQAIGGLVPADRFYGLAVDLEKELASYRSGKRSSECIYFCCNINGKRIVVSGPRNSNLNVYES